MSDELLRHVAAKSMKADPPQFQIGDTVEVRVRIVEGEKQRTQQFRGTVIARTGGGVSETFTVRRIVNNEGVERTFPVHSPQVVGVKVVRSGRVRRAKLYFLRDRVGKSTRLKEVKRPKKAKVKAEASKTVAAEAPADE